MNYKHDVHSNRGFNDYLAELHNTIEDLENKPQQIFIPIHDYERISIVDTFGYPEIAVMYKDIEKNDWFVENDSVETQLNAESLYKWTHKWIGRRPR